MTEIQLVQLGERLALGTFFAISGAHKLFDPIIRARMSMLFDKLRVKWALQAVSVGEFLGGFGLITGTLTHIAAAGMMVILAGAIYLDVWKADVADKNPRDLPDWVAKTLYCPEVLMFWLLASVILLGPGPLSVDGLIREVFPSWTSGH